MKNVIVTKYLNVRVGQPSLSAPCYQYLAPGSKLETDGFSYKGDRFEGIDDWLRDEAGNYYWSGGVVPQSITELNRPDYWFNQLGISDIWNTFGEKGEQARVLVLDSGINDFLPVFNGAILEKRNFTADSRNMFSNDRNCHGTHCAGLIAARSSDHKVGVAPEAKLLIGKITENGYLDDGGVIRKALEEFLKPEYEFDIISISATIIQEDLEMKSLMDEHLKKNRIIVAAIGNDASSKNSKFKRYPGYFDNCIAVGACESNLSISPYTYSPEKVTTFCYGSAVGSFRKHYFPETLNGTSQATAVVSGICALLVSFLKKRNIPFDQEFIRQLLMTNVDPLSNFPGGAINPKLLFNHLTNIS